MSRIRFISQEWRLTRRTEHNSGEPLFHFISVRGSLHNTITLSRDNLRSVAAERRYPVKLQRIS